MDAQLRKGLLEYCVLTALSFQDSYGYQIIKDVSEYIDISESTLYPILRRLESDDKVTSYNTASSLSAPHVYRSASMKSVPARQLILLK